MPERWLQVKGDPSVKNFLFEQSRIESLFDTDLDRIHEIVAVALISAAPPTVFPLIDYPGPGSYFSNREWQS